MPDHAEEPALKNRPTVDAFLEHYLALGSTTRLVALFPHSNASNWDHKHVELLAAHPYQVENFGVRLDWLLIESRTALSPGEECVL